MSTMNSIKSAIVLLLLTGMVSSNAWADRGGGHRRGHSHGHFGVIVSPYWGAGYYGSPFYYPPGGLYTPYPYYPPVVVERADPPVYIERQTATPAPAESLPGTLEHGFWYYCPPRQAYYPYVEECPTGWQKVAPQSSSKP